MFNLISIDMDDLLALDAIRTADLYCVLSLGMQHIDELPVIEPNPFETTRQTGLAVMEFLCVSDSVLLHMAKPVVEPFKNSRK